MKPRGHLVISKLYEDGREELLFDEDNVITSGMGVGFSHLFAASGATTITDYQILNFAVGSGGNPDDYGVSSFKLNDALLTADYGGGALIVEDWNTIEDGTETGATVALPRIRFSNIHRVTDTSVRYTLVVDRDSCNDLAYDLDEVGLFMRNPRGLAAATPILVAYRPFTAIRKTSAFSLIFRWTLTFG
jgi:hypothetical protein